MNKALVILSGGQDSTTCLFWALQNFDEVHAVTFHYGQRHWREMEAARSVFAAARRQAPDKVGTHRVLELVDILESTSPLVSDSELEQYEDHRSLPGGLEKTFVPMRNQLFITVAANRAYALGCRHLVTGVCQEDFGGYPDCRQAFINAIQAACNEGTFTGQDGALDALRIHTPLMYRSKAEAVKLAHALPGCWDALACTHTAYDGQYPPTGKDHACLLRAKGFEEAGLPDPLVVRAWREGLMDLPDTPNYTTTRTLR